MRSAVIALLAAVAVALAIAATRWPALLVLLPVFIVAAPSSGWPGSCSAPVAAAAVVAAALVVWALPWALALVADAVAVRPALAVWRFTRASPAARRHYPAAMWASLRWRWLARNTGLAPADYKTRHAARDESLPMSPLSPKTGRSRTVSIDAETVHVLKQHRARQAAEQLTVGPEWRGRDDYVFTTGWGEPVHPDTVSSLMADLIRSHNEAQESEGELLPHARLHDLRHIHATTLLLAGVPVHVVGARLGHADPSITLGVYAHVIREQVAKGGGHLRSVRLARWRPAVSKSASMKAPPAVGKGR
jgi:hypothetical protein